MKEVTIEQLSTEVGSWIETAQQERVLVLRSGKPIAVIIGVEDNSEDDLRSDLSVECCRMIEERRRRMPTIPLKDLRAQLGAHDQSRRASEPGAADGLPANNSSESAVSYAEVRKLFDPEEIKRRKERSRDDPGSTLDEIMSRLQSLEKGP